MSDAGEAAEWLRRALERRSQVEELTDILGILGTSRDDGETARLAQSVFAQLLDAKLLDLSEHKIAPYDYRHRAHHDDFIKIASLMSEAKAIVFASPVYWYAMSGQMKIFFDRLTDLTEIYKPIGKSLSGKTAFLIATGGSPAPPPSFEHPFEETAHYFDMRWGGMHYAQARRLNAETNTINERAGQFAARVLRKTRAQALTQESLSYGAGGCC